MSYCRNPHNLAPNSLALTPNEAHKNQTIFGFGGAFTDAAGINIARLSSNAQQNLIHAYFGPEGRERFEKSIILGIGYTIARTPIASCDFSTHNYSYDDVDGDFNLSNFSLTQEDFKYKVRTISFRRPFLRSHS